MNKKSLPVWSIILGLSSLVLGVLTGLPAIICGHLFLKHCKKIDASCAKRDVKLAIVGLCFGYLSIAFTTIFLILFVYSGYKI